MRIKSKKVTKKHNTNGRCIATSVEANSTSLILKIIASVKNASRISKQIANRVID